MEKWYLFNVYTFCKSLCVINVGSPYGLHGDPIYIWYLYDQMWLVGKFNNLYNNFNNINRIDQNDQSNFLHDHNCVRAPIIIMDYKLYCIFTADAIFFLLIPTGKEQIQLHEYLLFVVVNSYILPRVIDGRSELFQETLLTIDSYC